MAQDGGELLIQTLRKAGVDPSNKKRDKKADVEMPYYDNFKQD